MHQLILLQHTCVHSLLHLQLEGDISLLRIK